MRHWIQNHILLELTRHETRRYSQLRPRDVESNLFIYHLKDLARSGYVEKAENGYQLSAKGINFSQTLSLSTGKTRQQPKILTLVVGKNDQNEYLWVRWHRQPNSGRISFPHGMMHYGESIVDMAALELAEKAGLEADMMYLGEVYVRGIRDEKIELHMLVHIFTATNIHSASGAIATRPEVCESFWAPFDSVEPESFVPGFYEIAQLVDKNKLTGAAPKELVISL